MKIISHFLTQCFFYFILELWRIHFFSRGKPSTWQFKGVQIVPHPESSVAMTNYITVALWTYVNNPPMRYFKKVSKT